MYRVYPTSYTGTLFAFSLLCVCDGKYIVGTLKCEKYHTKMDPFYHIFQYFIKRNWILITKKKKQKENSKSFFFSFVYQTIISHSPLLFIYCIMFWRLKTEKHINEFLRESSTFINKMCLFIISKNFFKFSFDFLKEKCLD